jgi:hypothetical protein
MHKVPHLAERLQSLLYKLNFKAKVEEVKPDVRNVKIASQELKNNDKITKLLDVRPPCLRARACANPFLLCEPL